MSYICSTAYWTTLELELRMAWLSLPLGCSRSNPVFQVWMSSDHFQADSNGEAVKSVRERKRKRLFPGAFRVLRPPLLLDNDDLEAKKGWTYLESTPDLLCPIFTLGGICKGWGGVVLLGLNQQDISQTCILEIGAQKHRGKIHQFCRIIRVLELFVIRIKYVFSGQ